MTLQPAHFPTLVISTHSKSYDVKTDIRGRKYLVVCDGGDDLQRRDPVNVPDDADHRLDAHASKPAQLPDQLPNSLAILADIEGERASLLDLPVVPALGLAVPAQDVELLGYLWARAEAAGVGVARDQAQGLPLAAASDHDRRVESTQTLWEVQRPLQTVVLALEGAFVATLTAPHLQADLNRLFQHLETLLLRREGNPKPARLLFVVAGADAEPGAAAREHVKCGHRLHQDGRIPEMHPDTIAVSRTRSVLAPRNTSVA